MCLTMDPNPQDCGIALILHHWSFLKKKSRLKLYNALFYPAIYLLATILGDEG
jgi:hypothetical protein